jgi:hypothetical protein
MKSRNTTVPDTEFFARKCFQNIVDENIARTARMSSVDFQRKAADERRYFKEISVKRVKIQRAIFLALRETLKDENIRTLMDLLSGDALVALSLIKAGVIDNLAMVDNFLSPNAAGIAKNMIEEDQSFHGKTRIINNTFTRLGRLGEELPATENATLIDTGLSLPIENRVRIMRNADEFRSSHIEDEDLRLADILKSIGPTGRTLHIFDTPAINTSLDLDRFEENIALELTNAPGWELAEVGELTDSPTLYAITTNLSS